MRQKEALLLFQPSGRRGAVPTGISLLEASQRIGGDIEALCGGQGRCGKCRVKIQTASFNKPVMESTPRNAGPWRTVEADFISDEAKSAGERLACAATVHGDMAVYVPESSRTGKQVVSKSARPLHIDHGPAVKVYPVTIPPPTMEAPDSDMTRLTAALKDQYGLTGLGVDLPALQQLPGVVKSGLTTRRLRRKRQTGMREFVIAWADETCSGQDITVTQKDIRQIQLAKAAVYTGCKLLLRHMRVKTPDRVKVACAFGFHVDRQMAMAIGLFSSCPLENVSAVGNATGDGCRAALLDRKKRREAERMSRRLEFIELAQETDFQQQLIAATQFPT